MNPSVEQLLKRYSCHSVNDYIVAVREIMQELALQGLWRAGFFEQAAFYGGTSLRILYGLDRSSEDMDFSLLAPSRDFRLETYSSALKEELELYGFPVEFSEKKKTQESTIDSAFLKGNTLTELISIGLPETLLQHVCSRNNIKIKLEVDIDPPLGFQTEKKIVLVPIPHVARTYTLPDLLAGKLHAVLCRRWQNRVKGRDWYDMAWYAARHPEVNLKHLEIRMRQSNNYNSNEPLTLQRLKELLHQAIDKVNIDDLKSDVLPFVTDSRNLDLWSQDFFHLIADQFTEIKRL